MALAAGKRPEAGQIAPGGTIVLVLPPTAVGPRIDSASRGPGGVDDRRLFAALPWIRHGQAQFVAPRVADSYHFRKTQKSVKEFAAASW